MTNVYLATDDSGTQAAHIAFCHALEAVGIPQDAIILKTEAGKPYFADYPQFFFNLSHSAGTGVCAVSDAPCGVDVEYVRVLRQAIVRRFFTHEEQCFLRTQPQEQVFRLWTRKESFVKALGRGLTLDLRRFSVLDTQLDWENQRWYFHEYPIAGGFLTACTQDTQICFHQISTP